jgi:hypothetical protein
MLSIRSQYLNELGISEFLHTTNSIQQTSIKLINTKCLVVERENANSICSLGATQDFLYKMLGAIGLQKTQVICIKTSPDNLMQELAKYKTQVILFTNVEFSSKLNNSFNISHPSDILKNEQLKRDAWSVLKKMKLCLK